MMKCEIENIIQNSLYLSPDMQFKIGECLLSENSPDDIYDGLDWMTKAAINGSQDGMFYLGSMFFKDNEKISAYFWLKKAAEMGCKKSEILLKKLGEIKLNNLFPQQGLNDI